MNAAQMQSLSKLESPRYGEGANRTHWYACTDPACLGNCMVPRFSLAAVNDSVAHAPVPTIDRVVGRTRQEVEQRIATLQEEDILLRNYLVAKFRANDLHGVEDAASDLRDLEAAMGALRWVLGEESR